ncbi:MAG TPA: 5-formyltetrahydrofolate cyclo-ligase [Spongiibacteraceae bacterium]|nr:5-formyltetrahydrofolate cyclo-ligase [Spongiibacteraceae bacterium]HCS27942.1 5-formyltetrahydrofolate cyclo-ligase [Spongiibacteraceae bacterium]
MTTTRKQELRQELRARRRQLSTAQQRQASARLDTRLRQQPCLRAAHHIAFYIASDGELSPRPTLLRLARQGRQCFLPCISGQRLEFRRYRPGQTMKRNLFNIPEPPARRSLRRHPQQLDVILLPLVGFDAKGNRLGMGGGFYDRTLGGLKQKRRPLLIGLAHEFQRLNQLPVQSWDIPLDAIATDKGFYWIKRRQRR